MAMTMSNAPSSLAPMGADDHMEISSDAGRLDEIDIDLELGDANPDHAQHSKDDDIMLDEDDANNFNREAFLDNGRIVDEEFRDVSEVGDRETREDAQIDASQSNPEAYPQPSNAAEYSYPVVVVYKEDEYDLFPPTPAAEPGTFCLENKSLASDPVKHLFQSLRYWLRDYLIEEDELEVDIAELGLRISEESDAASHYTLRDISDVYELVAHTEGSDGPQPLYIDLYSKTRFSSRLERLRIDASEGKLLAELEYLQAEIPEGQASNDDTNKGQNDSTGENAEQTHAFDPQEHPTDTDPNEEGPAHGENEGQEDFGDEEVEKEKIQKEIGESENNSYEQEPQEAQQHEDQSLYVEDGQANAAVPGQQEDAGDQDPQDDLYDYDDEEQGANEQDQVEELEASAPQTTQEQWQETNNAQEDESSEHTLTGEDVGAYASETTQNNQDLSATDAAEFVDLGGNAFDNLPNVTNTTQSSTSLVGFTAISNDPMLDPAAAGADEDYFDSFDDGSAEAGESFVSVNQDYSTAAEFPEDDGAVEASLKSSRELQTIGDCLNFDASVEHAEDGLGLDEDEVGEELLAKAEDFEHYDEQDDLGEYSTGQDGETYEDIINEAGYEEVQPGQVQPVKDSADHTSEIKENVDLSHTNLVDPSGDEAQQQDEFDLYFEADETNPANVTSDRPQAWKEDDLIDYSDDEEETTTGQQSAADSVGKDSQSQVPAHKRSWDESNEDFLVDDGDDEQNSKRIRS